MKQDFVDANEFWGKMSKEEFITFLEDCGAKVVEGTGKIIIVREHAKNKHNLRTIKRDMGKGIHDESEIYRHDKAGIE